ncbi:acyltransferase family protein [Jidongwangia harbinensis]|uniref:acyltransferase family protein n=1 Tax=Jidongwangia harbinensis TaxID=2878561 RepID=UPI001CDA4001|nr:acyltransferase [Jidongwangia harbinensis]MCA2219456.1 acyltransferase [Jidongwangia harbinensis]
MTQTTTASSGAPATAPAPAVTAGERGLPHGARMSWLDVLRGIGALVVTYAHLGVFLDLGLPEVSRWVDVGRFGVLLFFLVSGYVIPMSLERHGSLRRFWVGRLFRLYPAWLLAVAVMAVLIQVDVAPLLPPIAENPAAAVLGHLVMSQELIGLPGLLSVFWTLSFEMLFYLLVSALFVLGRHGREAAVAAGLAVAALLGVRTLPAELLTGTATGRLVAAAATFVVFGLSIAAYLSGRRRPALVAAVAGLGCLVLPVLNGGAGAIPHALGSWQALAYLAVMFSGTVLHAAHRGRVRPRVAAATLSVVFVASLLANLWHAGLDRNDVRATGTLVGVAATFAIGYALRHRTLPGWATWLGRISYSLYLLHFVALFPLAAKIPRLSDGAVVHTTVLAAGYLALVLLASHLSYTLVERPGQRLGNRVGRALDACFGSDVRPAVAPEVRATEVPLPRER